MLTEQTERFFVFQDIKWREPERTGSRFWFFLDSDAAMTAIGKSEGLCGKLQVCREKKDNYEEGCINGEESWCVMKNWLKSITSDHRII